jgi:hypothetical protein
VKIPTETLLDMTDTAGYVIGYWAQRATQGADGSYRVQPHDGKAINIKASDLRKAFKALAASDQSFVNERIHGYFKAAVRDADSDGIDAGHIDGDAADCLVQVAAFGKVIYG